MPTYGVFALESRHAVGFEMPASQHEFLELFLVMEGSGMFWIDHARHACHAGQLVSVPPRAEHRIYDDPQSPLAMYGLCVMPALWTAYPRLTTDLPAGTIAVRPHAEARLREDYRRILFEQSRGGPVNGLKIQGLTLLLLEEATRQRKLHEAAGSASNYRQVIRDYITHLSESFFEHSTIDAVADELGISRRRFTTLFREEAGESWSRFIEQRRTEHADLLLTTTDRTVESIAFECGYEDVSVFYRAFRRRFGVPPSTRRPATNHRDRRPLPPE